MYGHRRLVLDLVREQVLAQVQQHPISLCKHAAICQPREVCRMMRRPSHGEGRDDCMAGMARPELL